MQNQPAEDLGAKAVPLIPIPPQGSEFSELPEAEIFAKISAALLDDGGRDTIRTAWTNRLKEGGEVFSRRIASVLIRAAVAVEDTAWLEAICRIHLNMDIGMHPLSAQRAFDLAQKHGNETLIRLIRPHLPETKKTRKSGMKTSAKCRGISIPHDGTRPRFPTRWSPQK